MDTTSQGQDKASQLRSGFQLDQWYIEPKRHHITGPEGAMRVPPRAMEVLVCLAEQAGDVVSREALLEQVWGNVIVTEDALTRCIADLRKLFKEDAKEPRLIETIRMGGYRLMVPVQVVQPAMLRAPAPPRRRWSWGNRKLFVAVLAFFLVGLFGFYLGQPAKPRAAEPYRAVPLTTYEGTEFDVAISPDGEKVVFAAILDDPRSIEIYVKRIGTEMPLRLTHDPGVEISPAWSPDGQAVAFLRGSLTTPCALFLVALPGGDERKIADCHELNVTGVSFSPDGTTIVYSDRKSPDLPFQLHRVDIETLEIEAISAPESGFFGDFSASFSPDGSALAFLRGTVPSTLAVYIAPALADVHILDLESGEIRRLTHDNQEIPHIDWSADGKDVLFASNRERGSYGLWRIPVDGGDATWLMGGQGLFRKPSIARKANRMVFEQWHNDTDIWHRPVWDTTVVAEGLIASTRWESNPQFSPDGTMLAFVSRRTGATEVWISHADGTRPIQVTNFKGAYVANPSWSPDGTRIAFERHLEGHADIFTIDARGGQAEQITTHIANDMVPSWSRDGQWMYYGSNRTGQWQVWRTSLVDGQQEQVTENGGYAAQEGYNGQSLYYTHIDGTGLWRKPLKGGPCEEIVAELSQYDWGNWAVGKTGLYYVDRTPARLNHYAFGTGQIRTLGRLPRLPVGVVGLTISPDESQVVFNHQLPQEADLWMVDDFACCR